MTRPLPFTDTMEGSVDSHVTARSVAFAGAIDAGGYVGAVVMPGGAAQTRKELDGWQDWAKARGAKGLAYVVLDAESVEARGPVAKNLS